MKAKKGIDCTAAEAQEQQDKVNDITEKMMMLHNQVLLFLKHNIVSKAQFHHDIWHS